MPSRSLIGMTALVGAAFAAAAILLPHSPAELWELIFAAGIAAPAIALGAWILLTPAMFSGTVLAAASGLAFGAIGGAALCVVGAVLGGLAAFALARTAGRTHVEATLMRRAKLRKIHALLERRGFLTMLAARLMPGVPATGLHYVAGVAPVGVRAFAAAMTVGALCGRRPMPCSARGSSRGRAP